MQKALIILPRKLFPLVSGYSLKNFNLIKILSKQYELDIINLSSESLNDEEVEFYKKYSRNFVQASLGRCERLVGVLGALIKGEPLQVGLYYSGKLARSIKRKAGRYDVIISELVRTMPYIVKLEKTGKKPVKVFEMVDSIGLNYKNAKKNVKSPLMKAYYGFETGRLLRYEKKCIESADITYLFNHEEAEYWDRKKSCGRVLLLPHGVREELLEDDECGISASECRDNNIKPYVVFLGKMNYQPNVDAVLWYVENIHTKLKNRLPLKVVGAYPTDEIEALTNNFEDIEVTGFVDDPYPVLKKALAVIAPMQTGGGIQNKVLETMALGGVAVVSSLAAAPIKGASDGEEFMVCNTYDEYDKAYRMLLDERQLADKIGSQARRFIKEHYTWEKYGEQFLGGIREL